MTIIGTRRAGSILLRSASAVVAPLLVAGLFGCAVDPTGSAAVPSEAATTTPTSVAASSHPAASALRIVLTTGDVVVPATLADTWAARRFAALLPQTVQLRDPMGQAASGRLGAPLDVTGADLVNDPVRGDLYYAPGSQTFAVFHDDLGQAVPPPGLVRLGAVDAGSIAAVRSLGRGREVRIDLVRRTVP